MIGVTYLEIVTEYGRKLVVRVEFPGKKDKALIVFFEGERRVRDYYAGTIAKMAFGEGLSLFGGDESWNVDAENMTDIIGMAREASSGK